MPVEQGRHMLSDRALEADVVIVGTGAGGAMAASMLARTGARVVALEEGPWLEPQDMSQQEVDMMAKLYQERGARMTQDMAIRVLGGRCVGGSTVHNINLCKRAPAEILELWARDHQVTGLSAPQLEPVYESVERDLSVTTIPDEWHNVNNSVLKSGVSILGWRGGALQHNRVGCQRTGFCELGCPYNAKQNASKILIPDAVEHGALVLSDAEVVHIDHASGEVRGVRALAIGANRRPKARIHVRARAVVLAGSAIGSAALAIKSALPDPHGNLGSGLTLHPGVAVAGLFGRRIEGWKGIPQTYECTEFLDFTPGSERRVWITTAFAHPIGTAVSLPGFGQAHRDWMLRYPNLAVLTAMIHDETTGQVRARSDGRPLILYRLRDTDIEQLALGIRACARILFAAGANAVLIPSTPPRILNNPVEIGAIPNSVARPHQIGMAAVHPMGTLRLGDDPRRAVVQSTAEHHQVKGLFVLDGSLFPTSLGVPPQISIYAFSRYLSRHVTEYLAR